MFLGHDSIEEISLNVSLIAERRKIIENQHKIRYKSY
jgi:hypothetical protein